MKTQRTAHRAAVITPGATYYGDGTMRRTDPSLGRDLPHLLGGASRLFGDQACVIVDQVDTAEVGHQLGSVLGLGWRASEVRPWTLFHREGQAVAVGWRQSMDPAHHFAGPVQPDTDPGVLAVLLDRYHQLTGTAWRGLYSTTGLAGIRESWPDPTQCPLWQQAKATGPGRAVGPLIWRRPLNEFEATWGYVHEFDVRSAYLGAAINAEVAWSNLEHTGARPFAHNVAGYWRLQLGALELADLGDRARPPIVANVDQDGTTWVTTPIARLLRDVYGEVRVVDSWTGGVGRRVFRKWGEKMRDARITAEAMAAPLGPQLVEAVKETYKATTGAMQREVDGKGMRIRRADWAHTLIDGWRATLYRRILAVHETEGVWPVRTVTDSLAYADCAETPRALLQALHVPLRGVKPGLGQYLWAKAYSTAAWEARHAA